jgi:hypothetical protein
MRHRERGTRNSQPGQDVSDPDQILEALLAGWPLPDEDQAALRPVADVLAALRQPAAPAELTGQASALAAFRAQPRRTARAAPPRRRRGLAPGPLLRPRPALLFAGAAMLAGLAIGGYEGDLPAPVQEWAHHTFGLTAVRAPSSPKPTPSGHTASATPDSSPDPAHQHRPSTGRAGQPGQRTPQHDASHQPDGKGRHRHGRSRGTAGPSPATDPSSAPTPGGQGTPGASSAPSPGPSNSPAAQPSAQPSTSPGPQHRHNSASSPP